MKTCHVCGTLVDDTELICHECGATVVKRTQGFSLKDEEPAKKKRTNPMGTTVSTGSGLTNILRGEDDEYIEEDVIRGSIPISMARTEIGGDFSAKQKSNVGGTIFKIILFCALAYGVYFFVNNVILKEEGATEYKQAIEYYIDAVNDNDTDKLLSIIPPYITNNENRAEMILEDMQNIEFDEYQIVSVTTYDESELIALQDSIKLQTTKTANLKEACIVKLQLSGTNLGSAGSRVPINAELDLEFVNIRDRWYLHIDTYDNPDFQ